MVPPMVPRDDILVGSPADTAAHLDVPTAASLAQIAAGLQTRCVPESRRETWFVVNNTDAPLTWVALPLEEHRIGTIRRVQVNGEAAAFSDQAPYLAIELVRTLRIGQGTIVVVQYR